MIATAKQLDPVTGLSDEELLQLWKDRAAIAKVDPWYWLQYFTYTIDEHDPLSPAKPMPKKLYLRIICRGYREFTVLFIKKSRQIMMTWTFASLLLWDAVTKFSRLNVLQSRDQEDANKVIERCTILYDNLVRETFPILGEWVPRPKMTGQKTGTKDKIEFPTKRSRLVAIPAEPDAVRSNTGSNLFADEMNHQPDFEGAYGAALPAIAGGGKYMAAGTANGNTVAKAVMECLDPVTWKSMGSPTKDSRLLSGDFINPPESLDPVERRYWIEDYLVNMDSDAFNAIPFEQLVAAVPGMDYWQVPPPAGMDAGMEGINCMWVHYSADPDKDRSVTPKGKIWYQKTRPLFLTQRQWDREMEGKDNIYEGRPVIDNWDESRFVRPHEELLKRYDESLPLLMSFDFGTILCGTPIAQWLPIKGSRMHQLVIFDEQIFRNSHTPEMAGEIVQYLENSIFKPSWLNNRLDSFCDPNGNREEGTTADKSLNSHIKVLESVGIYPDSTKFGVPESTQLLETIFYLRLPDGSPVIQISDRCRYFIRCFEGGLHYPQKKAREGYYEKDGEYDHGGDMFRYLVANKFDETELELHRRPESGAPEALPYRKVTAEYSSGRVEGRVYRGNNRPQRRNVRRRFLTSRFNYV